MTDTQTVLLIIQIVLCVAIISYLLVENSRAKRERQRYRLVALRDDLLYLVASRQLEPTDRLFQLFYDAIDKSIKQVANVNFVSLVNATVSAKSVLERRTGDEIKREIELAPPAVKKVITDFALTMKDLVVANSFFLAPLLWIGKAHPSLLLRLEQRLGSHNETYQYFKGFNSTLGSREKSF